MNWHYTFTPTNWPSAYTFLLLIVLAVYSGRRRSVPGALPFTVACLFAALWAASSVMEHAAVDLETKIFWIKLQSFWQPPLVAAVTCFLLEYTWPGRWLTRRNLALFSIPPLLINVMILTDNLHHLVWRSLTFNRVIQPQVGPVGWIAYAYAFVILGALNLLAFGWLFRYSRLQRWPVVLMLVGQFGGRILYMLQRTGNLHSALPTDLLGMAFEFLMYAIALFGFQILDPIPQAYRTVIEQMQAGMLVLDPRGKIVNLNPAAGAILKLPGKQLLGNSIQNLLPALADPAGNLQVEGISQEEIELGKGLETRYYQLEASSLDDWRGLEVGRLLVLRDVTEQKWSQAQLIEQQKVVTTLHEREQLARDLHDSLGQVLGYISLQAQAIRKRIEDGQTDAAMIKGQLTRLAEIAQEAHRDVRESIFSLRTGLAENWSFFASLRGHLFSYQEHYGIQTELILPEGLAETIFEMDTTVQLLRVIQEALTNARKHGYANHVQISFACQENQVEITIADDGRGFDLRHMKADGESHLGLGFMRERMEQIHGSMRIETEPGLGTRVMLRVAMREGQKELIG